MPYWYEVFDNEQVQLATRKQAGMLTAVVGVAVVLTVAGFALGHVGLLPLPVVGLLLFLTWLSTVHWLAQRLRRLRRVVWCVKISDRHVVGYDYTRKKTTLDWTDVQRVELTSTGLTLAGPDPCFFEIPYLFPDFAELSHRIVHYADIYEVPVLIDGLPWQSMNVYRLYPFLADYTSSDRPDALPGSLPDRPGR